MSLPRVRQRVEIIDTDTDIKRNWFMVYDLIVANTGGIVLSLDTPDNSVFGRSLEFKNDSSGWVQIQCIDNLNVFNAAAVQETPYSTSGTVGFPDTNHGLVAGEKIEVYDTTNYDGHYVVHSDTTTNVIVVTATYTAETFSGTSNGWRRVDLLKDNCMTLRPKESCRITGIQTKQNRTVPAWKWSVVGGRC